MKSFQEFTFKLYEGKKKKFGPKIGSQADVDRVLANFKKGKGAQGNTLPSEAIPKSANQPYINPDKRTVNQLDALTKTSDQKTGQNIMNKLSAREKMNRAQSDATADIGANIKKSGNTYSPSFNKARDADRIARNGKKPLSTHASAQVTLNKDAKNLDIKPKFKATDPSKLNIKRKPSLLSKIKKSVKKSFTGGGKGSGTFHDLAGIGQGISDAAADKQSGKSNIRSFGKGLISTGAFMAAKPLSRVKKVGPVLSALAGTKLSAKAGKTYDKVIDSFRKTRSQNKQKIERRSRGGVLNTGRAYRKDVTDLDAL